MGRLQCYALTFLWNLLPSFSGYKNKGKLQHSYREWIKGKGAACGPMEDGVP
jgi:hypothetical protein